MIADDAWDRADDAAAGGPGRIDKGCREKDDEGDLDRGCANATARMEAIKAKKPHEAPTPRTDALVEAFGDTQAMIEHARQLERELEEAVRVRENAQANHALTLEELDAAIDRERLATMRADQANSALDMAKRELAAAEHDLRISVKNHAADLSAMSATPAKRLWLWKNFVDGRPEYWAFDNPYPTHGGGDPMTLGEPCGYAIFKSSTAGRTDVPEEQVIAAIRRAADNRTKA